MSDRSIRYHPSPLAKPLIHVAHLSLGLYLLILLGTGSVARSLGPLTWFPLWQLPTGDGKWGAVGVVSLLPIIAGIAWFLGRWLSGTLHTVGWGWRRVSWPLATLAAWGIANVVLHCLGSECHLPSAIRLLLLMGHLALIFLIVVNDKPDWLWVVVFILAIQSSVAILQFALQREIGLAFLGEQSLDPQVRGTSVVMRGPVRWLRAYGLATHPNVLAGTLVPLLLMLPVIGRDSSRGRRSIADAAFVLGFTALLTTLSRWAVACLGAGLALNLLPWAQEVLRQRRWEKPPLGAGVWAAMLVVLVLGLSVYGDAVSGRVVALETPTESRSLNERSRDTAISRQIIAAFPLTGTGLGDYLAAARQVDSQAKIVHVVPLHLAAETGLAGLAIWVWLVVWPMARRGALGRFAPETGLWLGFWLLGMFYPAPNPLYELRSVLLAAWIAGMVAQTGGERPEPT